MTLEECLEKIKNASEDELDGLAVILQAILFRGLDEQAESVQPDYQRRVDA